MLPLSGVNPYKPYETCWVGTIVYFSADDPAPAKINFIECGDIRNNSIFLYHGLLFCKNDGQALFLFQELEKECFNFIQR